ncbi:MAG: GFA family protein [Myxococcota bacterium]
MAIEGGCYCGSVRYAAEGDPAFKAQCHCRECQYIAGGAPNYLMGMVETGFSYSQGEPKAFRRSDLENPVTREFCSECGTHMVSKAPGAPGVVMIKVGTLDDPSLFDQPQMAIFTVDKQSFHHLPEGVASFERGPGG